MCKSVMCSPLFKQCFVTFGVVLNTMEQALINGFSSVLVPQLRATKFIELDDESQSWIASVHNISLIAGALIAPAIMGRFGRRFLNGLTAAVLCVAWFSMSLCSGFSSLIIVKLILGLASGLIAIVACVTVGEYTSPTYRGAFLTTIGVSYSFGMLFLHGLGAVLSWQNVSRILGVLAFMDCIIIFYSPESPSFLAARGRFEECKKAFRWLRYPEEEAELVKLIKVNLIKTEQRKEKSKGCYVAVQRKINYLTTMLKKREFYKPLILMFHLHLINEWTGATILDAYTPDIYGRIVGNAVNMSFLMISTDVQRIITNCITIVLIKNVRRRLMLIWTISFNIVVYLLIAAYVYAKSQGFNLHWGIGVLLIHLHIFCIAGGSVPLPNLLSGEIFSLEYRGLSSMIAFLFFVINAVINSKTTLLLFSTIGLHGAYVVYAAFVAYGLVVSWIMLPETKDKTLLEIEEKFRGRPLEVAEPLHQQA